MKKFDLDTPLIQFEDSTGKHAWAIRNAVEGVQIFGGIGSGKTSGSGRTLAIKYLTAGFGGLVLTVKPDEKDMWKYYCEVTGRSSDLVIIEPGGEYGFDFLQYLSSQKNSETPITANILETLKTVIRASEEKSSGRSDDPFWEKSLDMLLFHVIDLCSIAYGNTSVQTMYDIVQTLPKLTTAPKEDNKATAFESAFKKAKAIVEVEIEKWYKTLSQFQKDALGEEEEFEEAVMDAIPQARLLKFLDTFFFETFKNLSDKTRSIIEFSFNGFLFQLLREPIYSMFCKTKKNVRPEDSLEGKIILINLPVKLYNKVGKDCQTLFKYIWQVEMEKRNALTNDRPVFLWADEAQNFFTEHDPIFQATARSSLVATVYITQNLPNYHMAMGGSKTDDRVKGFLGTLGTKIFHANGDIETNKYASELIGDAFFYDPSRSVTTAEKFSRSDSVGLKLDRRIRPEEFICLKTGGERNNYRVEAYIQVQGDQLFEGGNFKKVKFNQKYN
ncbi:TraM recognition domain-containing protein [Mucilaginibacter sp. HMF5004]|uniref:type IV secretory system conjugative DNA transfer family protein n=1 Tax=Mucilaginibacter rivuli TaxID=2857527 RepID=UPI001C5DB964|nr:TraM recognition domain-containing protein [Mucilaginibacter rivuli]MBW4889200.1 TraM recognition domain-containing protein [Mucilaginibacter rivuli]